MQPDTAWMIMIIARADGQSDLFGQQYGVSAPNLDAAVQRISAHLRDLGPFEFVRVYATRPADFSNGDQDLVEGPTENEGVWYVSGRVWFSPGDEDVLEDFL